MDSIYSNPYLTRWLALGGLLILYIFFAAAETSLFALSPLDRLRLKERSKARGELVESLLKQSQRLLITLLVGVEVVTILASVLAASLALSIWGDRGKWIALVVMSPTLLLLGEIIPKSLALAYPARLAPRLAPAVRVALWVFTPVRVVLLQISRGILATLGFRPDLPVPTVHQEDFVRMVEESHRGGMIAALERDFIQNLLDFGEVRVGQIMVPRPDMFTLPVDLPFPEMIKAIKQSRFSRVPIYEETHDHVLGILHSKDILALCPQGPCYGELPRHILRPVYYVPENKKAFDLLTELQAQHQRLALVVDEYGDLVGLVSVEDLLEELCGEIPQEFQIVEEALQEVAPGVWRVKGTMSLADFNDALDLDLPAEEFDTIGGLVLDLFGSLPREGRVIAYDHLTFRVLRMKGTRILDLEVQRQNP
ncbi:MAG: hemolysin family protein [Thermodesulfobacteriota bacterium]